MARDQRYKLLDTARQEWGGGDHQPASAKRPPGMPAADSGKYIVRWVNDSGHWFMAQDIWNSDVAIPMAAASPNTKK